MYLIIDKQIYIIDNSFICILQKKIFFALQFFIW